MFDNVKIVHESWPQKNLIFTEGCNFPFNKREISDWKWGERYARAMINDFNNGTAAWTDWNILLDETGGPNHVNNICLAPIIANTKTKELVYSNSYYYIGHFSKFIKPGAKRIQASVSRTSLMATAFRNPNGSLVVVVLNSSQKEMPYLLLLDSYTAETKALARSISTFVIE